MSLFRGGGGGAYVRDKNTSVRVCTKNAGGAYARGGAYLRDTTVLDCSLIPRPLLALSTGTHMGTMPMLATCCIVWDSV